MKCKESLLKGFTEWRWNKLQLLIGRSMWGWLKRPGRGWLEMPPAICRWMDLWMMSPSRQRWDGCLCPCQRGHLQKHQSNQNALQNQIQSQHRKDSRRKLQRGQGRIKGRESSERDLCLRRCAVVCRRTQKVGQSALVTTWEPARVTQIAQGGSTYVAIQSASRSTPLSASTRQLD